MPASAEPGYAPPAPARPLAAAPSTPLPSHSTEDAPDPDGGSRCRVRTHAAALATPSVGCPGIRLPWAASLPPAPPTSGDVEDCRTTRWQGRWWSVSFANAELNARAAPESPRPSPRRQGKERSGPQLIRPVTSAPPWRYIDVGVSLLPPGRKAHPGWFTGLGVSPARDESVSVLLHRRADLVLGAVLDSPSQHGVWGLDRSSAAARRLSISRSVRTGLSPWSLRRPPHNNVRSR